MTLGIKRRKRLSETGCDGVLTAQIVEIGQTYYMLYAGKKGQQWQTGLDKTRKQ